MPEIVRDSEKFQVAPPLAARRLNPVSTGGYFEVLAKADGGFVLRPQRLRARGKPHQSLLEFLRESRTRARAGRSREDTESALQTKQDLWNGA
jgi:hypothetical protein